LMCHFYWRRMMKIRETGLEQK